jgi:hypothetical protein
MEGGFACPECGCQIRLAGLSPGRQVRCDWCRSWVEVPFIPRADQIKKMRRGRHSSRRRWPVWAWVAVTVLVAAIAVAGTRRVVRSQWQKAETEAVARLVEESREAEAAGRLGDALAALEGALTITARLKPPPPGLDELRRARDRLARREVEAQLAELDAGACPGDPGRAVGLALTLQARAQKDEALAGLDAAIAATLERLRLRWVEADAASAESADAHGQPGKALDLCQRQYTTADDLSPTPRKLWQSRATALARRVIARHGTILEPIRGQFTLGTPAAYAGLFDPTLTAALRREGYLPRPSNPLWEDLWSTLAPYRVSLEINESQEDTYLQSANQLSVIDGKLTLSRQGERIWHEMPVARSQIPLPGLPAYLASRVSVGEHRSAEFERLLYENARENLLHQLGSNLRRLPPCPVSGADAAPPAVAGSSHPPV